MKKQLVPLAEGILFQRRVEAIFEELLSTPAHLLEAEGEELSEPEQKAMDALMKTFVDQLKKGASEVKATAADSEELEDIKKDIPELEKLASKVKEGDLNEFVVSGALVAGLVAALPKLIELFGYLVKGIGAVLSRFGLKKAGDAAKKFAEKIVHAGHDLHKQYIGAIQQGLKVLVPGFKELDANAQKKIAEILYIVIILMLGLDAGFNAANALQHAEWVHVGIEGALAAIKSGEIGTWIASQMVVSIT